MKSLIIVFLFLVSHKVSAQTTENNLIGSYYNIKNALITGDANTAASNALIFAKYLNTIDHKLISEGNIHALAKDASVISSTKDLKQQRIRFSTLSSNFIAVAKAVKLNDAPVYINYCPMKKAYWMSGDKAIRNPYYGNAMLTCGEVTETLN